MFGPVCAARRLAPVCALVTVGAASVPATAQAVFRPLPDLAGGPTQCSAAGVSADGAYIVGIGTTAAGSRSVRWSFDGLVLDLGDIAGGPFPSLAEGVSSNGSIVVGSSVSTTGRDGYYWTTGTGMVSIGDIPGGLSLGYATDVADSGTIIFGQGDFGYDGQQQPIGQAFRWTPGTGIVGLGDLPGGRVNSAIVRCTPDGLVGAGWGTDGVGTQGVRWTLGGGFEALGRLPGGSFPESLARDLSADGSVVVGYSTSARGFEAVRWVNGTIEALGDLPGVNTDLVSGASAVSADGTVVVGSGGFTLCPEGIAFIWTPSTGMRAIRDVLMLDHGIDMAGWRLTNATGVSADGTIVVGNGINPDGQEQAWVARLGPACRADFNGDGVVDTDDFFDFLNAFLAGC